VNLINLGLGELLGLIGVVSAGVVALYLLDRSKHRQIVATLRFWTPAGSRTELKHRRRIQQPWSLLLQLLSLILLLIAIAGPQFGVFDGPGRDHVVILDTSSWMGTLVAQGTALDQAKANARAYLRELPSRDRVMLLRADAVATPATTFELDRSIIENAIQQSQPGASGLNLERAFDFATRAQSLQAGARGEIVFIGAGRVNSEEVNLSRYPSNLRVIASKLPDDNIGLRKVALRRSPTAPGTWDIFVAVHNYGTKPRAVDLALQYAQAPAGARRLNLAPGADEQAAFTYKEKAGGWLEARLNVRDSFPQDDRAIIEVPAQALLHTIVYSDDAQLRPLFEANPAIETEFRPTSAYDTSTKADLIVLDGFTPPAPPKVNTIWIAPPANGSVIPVKGTATKAALDKWNQDSSLGAGLYTRDVMLETTETFSPTPADVVIASINSGSATAPVVVARDGPVKNIAIGFHPGRGSMKYELATPLLIANAIRWMAPGSSRRYELEAGTVGTTTIAVEKDTNTADVHVLDDSNRELPFTIEDGHLRFFSGSPGNVRVQLRNRELLYSLSLPDLPEAVWKVPGSVLTGIPRITVSSASVTEIWPWLAVLGALGLLVDWILFGRNRAVRFPARDAAPAREWRKAS
jgi:hypothetical protein